MMPYLKWSLALLACALPGCSGRQYVDPDTVALIVTSDATGAERVNRCHFIPVLLGGQVRARYVVQDELKVTITITRDEVSLHFEEPGESFDPFVEPAETFGGGDVLIETGQVRGYQVELSSPCTPND